MQTKQRPDAKSNHPRLALFYLLKSSMLLCPFYVILIGQPLFLLAQPIPTDIPIPRPEPIPEPTPPQLPPQLPSPDELLQPPVTPTTPSPELPSEIPGTIVVEKFNFDGNTAFSDAELAEATKDFINRPLTFAELLQARSAITNLYTSNGYITSGALIPPQTLESGTITIQVVEGELEAINVTGGDRLNDSYVRSRLKLAARKPLNVNRLLEGLQLLQLDPLIETLSAELSAGTRPGSSILEVSFKEAQSFRSEVILDNGRTPSVGSVRRRGQINEGNLLGFGDRLFLSYTNTEGSNALDASYSIPFNPRNGTVTFSASRTSSNIIEPPFDQVDIQAASRNYEVSLRQPIIQTPNQELALGLSFNRQESDTTLLDVPFPLSPGANDQGETRINAIRFFQDWTQRDAQQVFAARSQFSLGLGWDATVNDEPPDSRFFAWRGQVQWLRQLAPDTLVLLRGDAQLATRALLPLEQFALGGLESVRGYRQDALLSDNGIFASAEVRIPLYRLPREQGVLQLTPFIDAGTAWNSSDNEDPDPSTLVSVGLGLRFQLGDRLTARIDYGIPLVEVENRNRTLQEDGIYFSIIASPF